MSTGPVRSYFGDDAPPAFTASRNGFPGLNVGAVEARISILSPVRGLRPARAPRFRVPKAPNPTIRTFSPLARASRTTSNTASTAAPAATGSLRCGRPPDQPYLTSLSRSLSQQAIYHQRQQSMRSTDAPRAVQLAPRYPTASPVQNDG